MPRPGVVSARAAWPALGTTAAVAVAQARARWRRHARRSRRELAAIDRACSRFRDDSELAAVNAGARATGARVAAVAGGAARSRCARRGSPAARSTRPSARRSMPRGLRPRLRAACEARRSRVRAARGCAGWRVVALDRADAAPCACPQGVDARPGATAKALAADRAAQRAARRGGRRRRARQPRRRHRHRGPAAGRRLAVRVADSHLAADAPGQTVTIAAGGLATSSTTVRRWRRRAETRTTSSTRRPARRRAEHVAHGLGGRGHLRRRQHRQHRRDRARRRAPAAGSRERGLPARLCGHGGAVEPTAGWPADASPHDRAAALGAVVPHARHRAGHARSCSPPASCSASLAGRALVAPLAALRGRRAAPHARCSAVALVAVHVLTACSTRSPRSGWSTPCSRSPALPPALARPRRARVRPAGGAHRHQPAAPPDRAARPGGPSTGWRTPAGRSRSSTGWARAPTCARAGCSRSARLRSRSPSVAVALRCAGRGSRTRARGRRSRRWRRRARARAWLPRGPLADGWARRSGTPAALLRPGHRASRARRAAVRAVRGRGRGRVRSGIAGDGTALIDIAAATAGSRRPGAGLRLAGQRAAGGGVRWRAARSRSGRRAIPRATSGASSPCGARRSTPGCVPRRAPRPCARRARARRRRRGRPPRSARRRGVTGTPLARGTAAGPRADSLAEHTASTAAAAAPPGGADRRRRAAGPARAWRRRLPDRPQARGRRHAARAPSRSWPTAPRASR